MVDLKEEDRLGSLPDDLLINILSLMPINFAAVSSVLSRRWRFLSTRVTRLNLDKYYFSCPNDMYKILFDIFKRRNSSKLDYFYLDAPYPSKATRDNDFYYLNSLLDQISRRNVQKIKVQVDRQFKERNPCKLPRIPARVFNNQHLIKLKFYARIDIDNIIVSSVNLPNLKKLILFVDSLPYELLERIIKFCPKLKKLSFYGEIAYFTRPCFYLSSEKLEYLNIGAYNGEFVIDTPNLKRLVIHPYASEKYRFVSKPNKLLNAEVHFYLDSFLCRDGHRSRALEIIHWISGVRELCIDYGMVKVLQLLYDHEKHTIFFFNNLTVLNIDYDDLEVVKGLERLYDDDKLPFFKNLAVLKILFYGAKRCWNDVLLLVRVFPNLQYLKVNEFDSLKFVEPDWVRDWVEPDLYAIDTRILTPLKKIKLKSLRGTNKDIAMIKYVLISVETLKLLIVCCCIKDKNVEAKFCEEISMLPKRSNCEIRFNGEFLRSSSKGFKMGSIDCQVL